MNKTLIQVLVGLLAGVALLMLAGCDEQWGIAPTVKAYRQEEVTFAVGDSTVIDADTSNGEIIIRGVEGVQEVHVVATLQTRGDTLEEAEERLNEIVYHVAQDGQTVRLRDQRRGQTHPFLAAAHRRYGGRLLERSAKPPG